MGFVLLLLYITLTYVFPAELFPELAAFRITYWVGMAGLAIAAVSLVFKRSTPLAAPQFWQIVAFTLALGASTLVAEQWLYAPVMALQRFGPSLAMFILTVWAVDSLSKLRITVIWIVFLSLVVLAQGAAAYHLGYNTQMFIYSPAVGSADEGDAPEEEEVDLENPDATAIPRIRGLGVFNDPNDLAMAFVVALALVSGAWTARAGFQNLFVVAVPAIALGYGVFLTHSRGGTVALLVTLWRLSVRRLGRVPGLLVVLVLAGGVVALDFGAGRDIFLAADASALSRVTAWREGLDMLKSQPFFGIGYGGFVDRYALTAHNSFVLCFAEAGVIGYFFWLGLIVLTFVQLHKLKALPADDPFDGALKQWATTLHLALTGFLAAAFFLSRTFVPLLYLVIGLSVALVLIARAANRPVWTPSLPRLGALVLSCEFVSIMIIWLIVKSRG